MIVSGKILAVDGFRGQKNDFSKLSTKLDVTGVTFTDKAITVSYVHMSSFGEEVGVVRVRGIITTEENASELKQIKNHFESKKELPEEFLKKLLGTINYICASQAVLVARALDLPAPIQLADPVLKKNVQADAKK